MSEILGLSIALLAVVVDMLLLVWDIHKTVALIEKDRHSRSKG